MKRESTPGNPINRAESGGKAGVLRARAQVLARIPEAAVPSDTCMDVVVFALGEERYAVEAAHVREVYPAAELTPLPCTPPFIAGVIHVRGDILAVVDLRILFELSPSGPSRQDETLIVSVADSVFGILTDRTLGMTAIPLLDIQSTLPSLVGIRAQSLKGVTSDQVIILDLRKMVAAKSLWVHEEVRL